MPPAPFVVPGPDAFSRAVDLVTVVFLFASVLVAAWTAFRASRDRMSARRLDRLEDVRAAIEGLWSMDLNKDLQARMDEWLPKARRSFLRIAVTAATAANYDLPICRQLHEAETKPDRDKLLRGRDGRARQGVPRSARGVRSTSDRLTTHQANAVFWMRAIDLTYGRVKDATADAHDRLQDAVFFAFSVDGFQRAVEGVAELSRNDQVSAALDTFRSVVPHGKDVRDILSHVEAHIEHRGRRQSDDPWPFTARLEVFGEFVLRIGEDRYVLDGDAAWKAAHRLYVEAVRPMPGWMTAGRLPTEPGT